MRRSRRGGAASEFAIIVPVLVSLSLGAIELSSAMRTRHNAYSAAQGGARLAGAVVGSSGTVASSAQTAVEAILADEGITCGAGCTLTTSVVTLGGLDCVKVDLTLPHDAIFVIDWAVPSVTVSASAPLRQQ